MLVMKSNRSKKKQKRSISSKEDKVQKLRPVREIIQIITELIDGAENSKSNNDFDINIEDAWDWTSFLKEEVDLLRVQKKKTAIFDAAWKIAAKKGHCDGYGGSEYRDAKAAWIASGRKTSVSNLP